jgi:hypothetical protein
MEKVCPRCKLPQNGINECKYCGLIFAKYKKLTFKEKLSQKKILTSELTLNSPIVDQIKQFFLRKSKRINKK